MTEAEWLTCEDPRAMIEHLDASRTAEFHDPVTSNDHQWDTPRVGFDRRFRLYSCLCCRRIWDQIPEEVNKAAVVAVEELLEGQRSGQETYAAFVASSAVEYLPDGGGKRSEPGYWAVKYLGRAFYKHTAAYGALDLTGRVIEALALAGEYGLEAMYELSERLSRIHHGMSLPANAWLQPIPSSVQTILSQQVSYLRDIFGNPFRPVVFPKSWRTEAAVGLALRMYDDRDFAAMPILADALEEAGCDDADILTHCREPGVHVRGCWVVDLVLGKV